MDAQLKTPQALTPEAAAAAAEAGGGGEAGLLPLPGVPPSSFSTSKGPSSRVIKLVAAAVLDFVNTVAESRSVGWAISSLHLSLS